MMNKLYRTLIALILIITVASAAVYTVTTNPEAKAFFSRDKPVVTTTSIQTLMQMDNGVWSNSIDFGKMAVNDDTFSVNIQQKNMADISLAGIPTIEITCEEGLTPYINGIYEFTDIIYTAPNGDVIHCADKEDIEIVSDNTIKIIPTGLYYFAPGTVMSSSVDIEFYPGAYGNYTLMIYVD